MIEVSLVEKLTQINVDQNVAPVSDEAEATENKKIQRQTITHLEHMGFY